MIHIKENVSKNRKHYHLIFNETPDSPRSYASAILLRDYYQEKDIDIWYDDDWRYYFIVRRHFLRKKRKEHGGIWVCHYCDKPVHFIQVRGKSYQKNHKNLITVDHKIAISTGGDELDTNNMVECCYDCNKEKETTPYEIFYPQKREQLRTIEENRKKRNKKKNAKRAEKRFLEKQKMLVC